MKTISKSINWPEILLGLWESGDEYANTFASIRINRKSNRPYAIDDSKGVTRFFSTYKKAVDHLANLEITHKAEMRG